MSLAIDPNDSPPVSVSSRISDFQNRSIENASIRKNFIMTHKRHVLSSSVPSIPLVETECRNSPQNKALFEAELDLKNKVSNMTKKFDTTNESHLHYIKAKKERKEIFSSNRNITAADFNGEEFLGEKKCNSECSGSWSKLKSFIKSSIHEEKRPNQKQEPQQNEKMTDDSEVLNNCKNSNDRSSTISLETKLSKTSISSSNINSIRSSSSSVTVSGSSICALTSSPPSPACSSPNSSTKDKNNMPFKIRSSKYRHVYGSAHKEDVCYRNIKITKNAAHDSAFCAVNPKFVAIVTEECGGGAFVVLPIKQTGRVDINTPKVTGHRGPVLDLKWNPFNDNEIASCSEDCTIKVWQIGDTGLFENLTDWCVDLHGHQRKVTQIEWHPTAENIMISSGADCQVIVWNLEKAEPIKILTCHSDIIQSMNWMRDGSLFATTCKDKRIRLIDPRTGAVVNECDGHQGSKISKVIILGCGSKLFTTGFSKLSERQIALWDLKDLSKPIQMETVDCSSGVLVPFYDHDTKIVYVAGKGDGNIRYYEITDADPFIHYLSEYKSSTPQRGLGVMPKRGLDVTKNEIFRFYKLHTTGSLCEPVSMVVPRKSEMFQEDIYPETLSGIPSMSCEEWISGENRDPILVSLKDGAVSFMPKIVTYKQVGYSRLGTNYSRSFQIKKDKTSGNCMQKANILRTNSLSANHAKYDQNTVPLIEVKPIQRLNTNSRSAFSSYKSCGQDTNSPSASNSLHHKQQLTVDPMSNGSDSFSTHFNYTNMSYNTEDLTLDAMVHANLMDGMSPNESISLLQPDNNENCSFRSIAKQSNDLEASYMTSMSKNPITLRKTESLKLDSVQSIRNRFNRMNTNTLSTLTRKSSQSYQSKPVDQLHHHHSSHIAESDKSLNTSLENLNPSRGLNGSITYNKPSVNVHASTSPVNLVHTDSSDSPNPLVTSTASLSSSSSSSNTTAAVGNELLVNHCSVKKRVWTPITQNNSLSNAKQNELSNGSAPTNLSELRQSYFRVKDQLNQMEKRHKVEHEEQMSRELKLTEELKAKEQRNTELEKELNSRDKRIETLENKLNFYLMNGHRKSIGDATELINLSLTVDSDC